MTVRELIEALKNLDQDAVIEIADGYTRCEGWQGEDLDNASSEIAGVRYHRGRYIIEEDEDYLN